MNFSSAFLDSDNSSSSDEEDEQIGKKKRDEEEDDNLTMTNQGGPFSMVMRVGSVGNKLLESNRRNYTNGNELNNGFGDNNNNNDDDDDDAGDDADGDDNDDENDGDAASPQGGDGKGDELDENGEKKKRKKKRRDKAHLALQARMQKALNRHTVALAHPRAFHVACHNGFLNTVRAILDSNPHIVNQIDDANRSGIGLAAENGHLDIMRLLVARNADVNQRDNDPAGLYFAPIHWCAAHDHIDAARFLLREGAAMNIRSGNHQTPLHIAAMANAVEFLKMSCDRKDPVWDARDRDGRTPLICAAMRGSYEACDIISATGTSLSIAEREEVGGNTALHRACLLHHERQSCRVAMLLIDRIGPGEKARLQLEKTNAVGRTPLSEAANMGNVRLCRSFITRGCDPEKRDNFGGTAISLMWTRLPSAALLLRQERANYIRRQPKQDRMKVYEQMTAEAEANAESKAGKSGQVALKSIKGHNFDDGLTDKKNSAPRLSLPKIIQ